MIGSWDSYYVVFLSAVISLGIPASLALISFVFFPRSQAKGVKLPKLQGGRPNRTIIGDRINVRFFLAANAALILITLALELIPCATTLQTSNREGLYQGLVAIVTIASFAVLGLLYSIRKGDMGWLSTVYMENHKEKKSD